MFSKVKSLYDIDYVELMPYFELGFRRRLHIRNVTAKEQKIGYNLTGDNKSEQYQKSNNTSRVEEKKPESDFRKYLRIKDLLWK